MGGAHRVGDSLRLAHRLSRAPGLALAPALGVRLRLGLSHPLGYPLRLGGGICRRGPIGEGAGEQQGKGQSHVNTPGETHPRFPHRQLHCHPFLLPEDLAGGGVSHVAGDHHVQEFLLLVGHAPEQVLVLLQADLSPAGHLTRHDGQTVHALGVLPGIGMADDRQGVRHIQERPPYPPGRLQGERFQLALLEVGQGGLQGDHTRLGDGQRFLQGVGIALHAVALHDALGRLVKDAGHQVDQVHPGGADASQHLAHLLQYRHLLPGFPG